MTSAIYKSKKLKFFNYNCVDEGIIRALACTCINLVKLDLEPFSVDSDLENSLGEVFKNNKNLKFLKFNRFKNLTGKCLLNLNKNTVEEIRFCRNINIKRDYLIRSLPYF